MSGTLLGAYRPGTTWLHRLPAGAKLLGLVAGGAATVAARGPVSGLVALAVAVTLFAWGGAGLRAGLSTLRAVLVVLALLGAFQWWQDGPLRAVEPVCDLLALVLAATVLTTTTRVDEVLDVVGRVARPLRHVGLDPSMVALAFSLVVRGIPTTLDLARETREAALARGLAGDPRARLTPLVIRVVAHARATGDALHARGVGDDRDR